MDWAALLTGGVVALGGALFGYGTRLREAIRLDRRQTYLAFLHELNDFPHGLIEAARHEAGEDRATATEQLFVDLERREVELELVASRRVASAIRALAPELAATKLNELMTPGWMLPNGGFVTKYNRHIAGPRRKLVRAMRRDLHLGPQADIELFR